MTEAIASLQNNRVKLVSLLQSKARIRRKERKIVLEGMRLIGDAVAQKQRPEFLFYEPQSVDWNFIAKLQNKNMLLIEVTDNVMKHVSDTQSPQGIIGVFPIPQPKIPKSAERVLILDAISEPGNMGTILRTAGAAGIQVVILTQGCVDPYNPKVLRGGMGAHFRIPILEADWSAIRGYCDDLTVYFATGTGDLAYTDANWSQAWALVVGNEAHGVSDNANSLEGVTISIPMASNTESLNAAVATGVILFEAQRQRLDG
ncbi:MAG: RNA methyltransferase [Anaerolineae bacterium]|nr:RNA methyltransferase [Anaerolineae bacterium]